MQGPFESVPKWNMFHLHVNKRVSQTSKMKGAGYVRRIKTESI